MQKTSIHHYRHDGSSMIVNGGTLTVTETDYLVTNFGKEVVRFPIAETSACKGSSELLYEVVKLRYGSESIELFFLKLGAGKMLSLFGL